MVMTLDTYSQRSLGIWNSIQSQKSRLYANVTESHTLS